MQGEDSINSALIETCKDGHIETARVLLDQGAEVNYQDEVKQHLNNIF